jgi:environmental stress-induced protein Ves
MLACVRVMRLRRAADHRRMPWKNGGGVTTEIAIFPGSAGLDVFEWRLSMATVASDGPFSLFDGVDRTLAVLDGEGIVLAGDGLAASILTPASPPFAFAADRKTSARLIAGPVTDLNVMTRRVVWTHRVERLALRGKAAFACGGNMAVVFCASGEAVIASGGTRATLSAHDAAMIDAPGIEAAAESPAVLYVVRLVRAG